MNKDVVLVNIIGSVVAAMQVSDGNDGFLNMNYEPGRVIQIMKSLADMDNSTSMQNKKYPLVAMSLPIKENRGPEIYAIVKIPRIVIATLSNETDDVLTRFKTGGTYNTILYPCYYEFLMCLAKSTSIIGQDPDAFPHDKFDNPGKQPIGQGTTDYVDSIEILNLELKLTQIKTCK